MVAKAPKPAKAVKAEKPVKGPKIVLPHGRKAGPAGSVCSHCRWIDASNLAVGAPPGLGCRLWRNVKSDTPSCDQFAAKGAKKVPDSKKLVAVRKELGIIEQKMYQKQVGDCITTGSHYLDLITGGGVPGGKLFVVFGPEHSGKTTLVIKMMASALKNRIPIEAWDAEESWDGKYFASGGVDIDDPLLSGHRHHSGDEYYEYLVHLLRELPDRDSGPPQMLVVVDSAAAFLSAMNAIDPGKRGMVSGPAAVHSRGLPMIKGLLGRKKVTMVATNHTGEKPASGPGNPEYEKGGNALKFYSDMRLRVASRSSNGSGPTKLLPPFFRTEDKAGLVNERSWRPGVGGASARDRFAYAQVGVRKNKGFSRGHMGVFRVCTAGPGDHGLDLSYDLFQCLVATGQAEWLGGGALRLKLHKPVYRDGELRHPKVRGFYDERMTWGDFKKLIFGRGQGSIPGPDIEEIWQMQMACGWALTKYVEMQVLEPVKPSKGKKGGLIEDEDSEEGGDEDEE